MIDMFSKLFCIKSSALVLIGILFGCLSLSYQVSAQTGWYGGGSLGYTSYENSSFDQDLTNKGSPGISSLNSKIIPWHLFFGHRYNQYFGIEGGYQYLQKQKGNTVLQSQPTVNTESIREIDGFLFGLKGFLSVYNQYSLQISGGFYWWHMVSAVNSLSSGSAVAVNFDERKVTPYLAIDIHRNITNQTNFFIQWLGVEIDDENASVINVGFLHYISSK